MNRGNYIGLAISLVFFGFAYYFVSFAFQVPTMAALLIVIGLVCFMGSSAMVVYSSQFEGNVYLRRRFGGENVGVGILIEQGAFWRFYQINLSKMSVSMEGEVFMIIPKHIGFRRGGAVPYIAFMKGTGQSIDLQTLTPALNTRLNTAWLMEESTIASIMAANMFQNKIFLAAIIGFIAVGLLAGIGIYFSASASGGANQCLTIGQAILNKIPSPTEIAAGIPHA